MARIINCMDCVRVNPVPACDSCTLTHVESAGRWWCQHRTPYSKEYEVCKAGIDFRQWGMRCEDCSGENRNKPNCEQYSPCTNDEWAERERKIDERFNRIGKVRSAIAKTIQSTGDTVGEIDCPYCSGCVRYTQSSYNGHIHARCSTDGCVAWME